MQFFFIHFFVCNGFEIRIRGGKLEPVGAETLSRELLETNNCYLLDCGAELYVWTGRSTSLEERKAAIAAAEASTFLEDFSYDLQNNKITSSIL